MARSTGTISVDQDTVQFGGYITVSYTANFERPWAFLEIILPNGSVGQRGYISLSPDEVNGFTIGPTPSWGSGPGKGTVYLLKFNTRKGTFFAPIASDTFDIVA